MPPGSLASALTWVEGGSSSRTSPEPGGLAISGQQAFRDVGAETLVLVGLPGPVGETTVLVLADERSSAVRPEVVESLELLASLAAAHLRSAQAAALLQREASTDSLTGLPHRRGFEVALEVALDAARGSTEHARRSQDVPSHEVAVLLVDLDDFKAVNDSQGHLAGDELLRRVAGLLESALRSQDQLFRLGGDEFASVLDVADAQEAAAVAHRLLAAARSDPGAGGVSIGVAVARPGESSEELLTRADEALYVVKKAGKDGLHLAED